MKRTNRFLSIILTVIMVVGMLPISTMTVLADGVATPLVSSAAGEIAVNTSLLDTHLSSDGTLIVEGTLNEDDLKAIGYFGAMKKTLVTLDLSGISGVTRIPELTFNANDSGTLYHCTSLKEVILPSSITAIGAAAFLRNSSLQSINLSHITEIGSNAFNGAALKEVALDSVEKIGTQAFANCASLKKAACPKATSLGTSIFYGCTSLTEIALTAPSFEAVDGYYRNDYHWETFGSSIGENVTLMFNVSQQNNITDGKWTPKKSDGTSALRKTENENYTIVDYVDVSNFKEIKYVVGTFGDFIVTGDDLSGVSFADGILIIDTSKPVTISNTDPSAVTDNAIYVADNISGGANITLNGVNISTTRLPYPNFSSYSSALFLGSDTKLTLSRENTLKSAGKNSNGIVINNYSVTIDGEGQLTAEGDNCGIAAFKGTVIINGGIVIGNGDSTGCPVL